MRGERSGHGDAGFLDLEDTGARLPFVELGHHFLPSLEVVIAEALDHAAGEHAKYGRFLVIPVAREGIHSEILPQVSQNGIGFRQMLLVIYQNGHGLARNVPPAHPEDQALGTGLRLPGAVQHRIFQEVRVAGTVHPYIGADENVTPSQLGLQMKRFGGNYGIDTAHLVTHFPTNFKQVIGLQ